METDEVATALADLRREIDRLDESMHRLLMERGAIIDRLIRTKGTAVSGTAFRPDREAAMLRALAERHRGRLPLDAVEGIWRVIISTFTFVQAPFSVHGAGSAPAMRDAARFHFGFTAPYVAHHEPAAAIGAVRASRGDLALVPIRVEERASPWWEALVAPTAPKVIARLPFVERSDHPAGLPVLVVSRTGAGSAAGDAALYAVQASPDRIKAGLQALGGETLAGCGTSTLLAVPASHSSESVAAALKAPASPVGHHPPRFRAPLSDADGPGPALQD